MDQQHIRNVAVIAHVDHGKTTLVDAMLKQTNVFRDNQEEMAVERLLDSNDLERERGITILAKTCAITYQDHKINIIDTPGHADFSGEVERTLGMASGALLIVDAAEGPMPQTRYVLKMALSLGLKIIVVINKIDKRLARPQEAIKQIEDLFLELAKTDADLSFPIYYGIGRLGLVSLTPDISNSNSGNVFPLLDGIINHIPAPTGQADLPVKIAVSSLDYNDHLGRIVIGRIHQGILRQGQTLVKSTRTTKTYTAQNLMVSEGMERVKIYQAVTGDIVMLSGISDATIGDTLSDPTDTQPLPMPPIAEPTLNLLLRPNSSPFAGREGKYTTSRQLGERLERELENNVSLKIKSLDSSAFTISGRGELHLSVLLENMRREGYEMEVGKPEVIVKDIDGLIQEPIEEVQIVVPQEYAGVISTELGKRYAHLQSMKPTGHEENEYVYHMPTRTTLGLRSLLLTLTKGTILFNSQIFGYSPQGEPLPKLRKGALISATTGKAVEYGLRNLAGRGIAFITPGEQIYEGMIIGISSKDEDIEMNVCKEKNLTNHRSKSHQGITQMAADIKLTLEQALDFIEADELLEITPQSLRLRKKYLSDIDRRRARRHN